MAKEPDAHSAASGVAGTEPRDAQEREAVAGGADAPDSNVAQSADSGAGEELVALRAALEEAQVALEDARAEAEATKDQALRAAAEAENVRKRAERSIENAHKYALERFVGDLLPAVDSFERAVAAATAVTVASDVKTTAGEAVDAMAEGIELSLKLLTEAMARQGIDVVDPIGAPFDPKLHEAMTMVEKPEAEPGSVIEVFQKGYTVSGRLVRPARVIVAREPASLPETPSTGEAVPEET